MVPLVVYPSIDRAIFGKDESKGSKAFAARVISVIIFLAVVLAMWLPIFIWKRIVRIPTFLRVDYQVFTF